MVTRIFVPKGCVKQLTVLGWVSHGVGILSMVTALSTDHWLRRVSDGYHVGIFPCCPTFKCGKSVISRNGRSIDSFADMIIVGLLLVGLGWILSLTHSCVTWRNDKRTLFGLSYLASGLVAVGGITLVAGAIEFVVTIPGDMEDALRQNCQEQDIRVDTGFSFELFVTGAVAFILAGALLFLGSCKQSNPTLLTRNGIRPTITVSECSFDSRLETVTAHLASQRTSVSSVSSHHSPTASFHNPLNNNFTERQQRFGRTRRLSPSGHPLVEHDTFLQLSCPPSYESLSELFSFQAEDPEVEDSGQNKSACCPQSRSPPSPVQPPTYDDFLKDQPPSYKDPTT